MKTKRQSALLSPMSLVCALPLGLLTWGQSAAACGGFFCDSANVVNQSAERIVFAQEADGSVTQIVEVLYNGDAEKFAWLLPVPGTPEPGVGSVQALDQLQRNTNPSYTLNTEFENCRTGGLGKGAGFDSADAESSGGYPTAGRGGEGAGVTVLDAGKVGAFVYTTISVQDPEDPAGVALEWLKENEYDVGDLGQAVLEPYLANGLNLIAFKLEKGQSSGAIQPIRLRFVPEGGAEPRMVIPLRPTAVAADDNMPILVWVLGEQRAVPDNYYGLELNELLVNWFGAGSNYNDVVIAAANEAGGQGFVTEYASDEPSFVDPVGYEMEKSRLDSLRGSSNGTNEDLLVQLIRQYGGYDGMLALVSDQVELRQGISAEQFVNAPECYFGASSTYTTVPGNYYPYYDSYDCSPFAEGLDDWGNPMPDDPIYQLDVQDFVGLVEEQVLGPIEELDRLIHDLPYMTRLYTTMSAEEMTEDPVFKYKSDLSTVSNLHTADAYVYCDDSYAVTLADGTKVYGEEWGVWPYDTPVENPDDNPVPVNIEVLSFSGSGTPKVVSDNRDSIASFHDGTDASVPPRGSDAAKDAGGCSVVRYSSSPSLSAGGLWSVLFLGGLTFVFTSRRRRPKGPSEAEG